MEPLPSRNTASDARSAQTALTEQRPGVLARLRRVADRPWASSLAGFMTTLIVMLPSEYEAPLRSAWLLLSVRRP